MPGFAMVSAIFPVQNRLKVTEFTAQIHWRVLQHSQYATLMLLSLEQRNVFQAVDELVKNL